MPRAIPGQLARDQPPVLCETGSRCPLDKNQEAEWHRERGKYQELSMVFVWIAGLMNLLAIWDAVEGPAYGYDDQDEQAAPARRHLTRIFRSRIRQNSGPCPAPLYRSLPSPAPWLSPSICCRSPLLVSLCWTATRYESTPTIMRKSVRLFLQICSSWR